jgi:hypothetical protein
MGAAYRFRKTIGIDTKGVLPVTYIRRLHHDGGEAVPDRLYAFLL